MPRRKSETPDAVLLHIASSFATAWQPVVLPWFERVAFTALTNKEPVAVVTPVPGTAVFLRSKLLERNVPLLGVKFLTPARLRELLVSDESLPLREHLRLILAAAAESIDAKDPGDRAIAKSICRAPDNLLRVFDQVKGAGWEVDSLRGPIIREILTRFETLTRRCGFQFVHQADRDAGKSAPDQPRFSDLLIFGFDAAHWPLWPLLKAAALSARRCSTVLEYPREQTRSGDESWIGTWEETFKAATPVSDATERDRPFAGLFRPADSARTSISTRPQFLVGLNATEQAQAISAMALHYLQDKSCSRLGILFARSGALARLVSESLSRAGILHYDGIGHLTPGQFESASWNAWLDLQENHHLEPLIRFLESNPDSLGDLTIHRVRENLRRAYQQILIDDIRVLQEYCARQKDREEPLKIAALLGAIEFLPVKASLSAFLDQTETIFSNLQWRNRWTEIQRVARIWSDKLGVEFSRSIYLSWLKEIVDSLVVSRAQRANHPYSRVHLLTFVEADTHEWSHLILAGLNQGEWPKSQSESGFLPDNEIVRLNGRAVRVGKQGEGHSVVETDKTILLSSQDERQIAVRRFVSALESVEHDLVVTASLLQETAPERFWNPSELFSQVYFTACQAPLTQQIMSELRERTTRWLQRQHSLLDRPEVHTTDLDGTRRAYGARRTPDVKFGEYEFALREPIEREITLRATEWQNALKSPALIWLKVYLGLENEDPDFNQWNVATGNWVHEWLAQISGSPTQNVFVALPSAGQIEKCIAAAASTFRDHVTDICRACARTLPDWWISGWSNALALSDYLACRLTEAGGWPHIATEWKLEPPFAVAVNGGKLRLRGRIDVILTQSAAKDAQLNGSSVWIVDYKTGNTKSLAPAGRTPELQAANLRRKLVRGDAIQLGLYGLAAEELGAEEVLLSILSNRTDLERPQLKLELLSAHSEFWRELYQMQETGVFGLRGAIRNDFGFSPDYPLATLPIDKEFLDEKWVLTHPAFADDEDDRS